VQRVARTASAPEETSVVRDGVRNRQGASEWTRNIGELGALCACDNGIGFRGAASSNSMRRFSKGAFPCVSVLRMHAGVAPAQARLYLRCLC
jgi:hypothetical protein